MHFVVNDMVEWITGVFLTWRMAHGAGPDWPGHGEKSGCLRLGRVLCLVVMYFLLELTGG